VTKNDAAVVAKAAIWRRSGWLPEALHSAQLVVLGFLGVIFIGTLLLSLPAASRTAEPVSLLNALFTATSATCVTGLTVVDTGSRYSLFGQAVILCCIQIGGIGLMTFTTVFMVATGRRMAIADRIAIQESFYHSPTGRVSTLIFYILGATLVTEALGAAVLAGWWWYNGLYNSVAEALYAGIFHSISAFCNAGFALFPDNAMKFQSDPFVLFVFSALIISGGLGFLVGLDVKEFLQQRYFSKLWRRQVRERVEAIRPRPRVTLHTKFVVTMTLALLVIGSISYYGLEREGAFRNMSPGAALLNAVFCSVTARTAGFNAIDYTQLGGPALMCTMVLMFIGASPGSTGGGVKTSTFGLLLTYALFRWRGHAVPHAFSRSIPAETVERATSIAIAGVAIVIVAGSFLMGVEATGTHDPAASQARFLPVIFETFSAFGTVGLSMNYSSNLTPVGKLVICALMFVGRVGPLTLALAIGSKARRVKFAYAEENVMIG